MFRNERVSPHTLVRYHSPYAGRTTTVQSSTLAQFLCLYLGVVYLGVHEMAKSDQASVASCHGYSSSPFSPAAVITDNSKRKKKRRKQKRCSKNDLVSVPNGGSDDDTKITSHSTKTTKSIDPQKPSSSLSTGSQTTLFHSLENPLLDRQQAFLAKIPPNVRTNFFSDEHVSSEERAKIWEDQANIGEELINQYAWATPDPRALKIIKHFSPIVEIGCGSNAYWGKCMKQVGIDVVCYEKFPSSGGKFSSASCSSKTNRKRRKSNSDIHVNKGGPEVLSYPQNKCRTLFLCYPDEEEQLSSGSARQNITGTPSSCSMAKACLDIYRGAYIIHVGELYGDSISLDSEQAPWGRSSSWEFQLELTKTFHCVLKCSLKSSWLHVRDYISVWKRTTVICTIAFAAGDDGECSDENGGDVEEVQYRHIPSDERLPLDIAAPFIQHLLSDGSNK